MTRPAVYNLFIASVLFAAVVSAGPRVARGLPDYDNSALPYRPGHVVLWVKSGIVPTIPTLLPDVPFAQAKSYVSWRVTPLAEATAVKRASSAPPSFLDNLYLLSFPDTIDVIQVAARLGNHPDLVCAEPDFALQLFALPQDSLFMYQWYLHNTGQGYYGIERIPGSHNDSIYIKYGVPGEDIGMTPVYDNPPTDATEVIVAIIDTGVDCLHPDLDEHIYHNLAEIPGNGVDDDHNGLVDDITGWDLSGNTISTYDFIPDNDPSDYMGHGTHLAGLVGAVQNTIGIAGFPGNIKIMPVKIFPNGFSSLGTIGIIYAADMGARVINASWGASFESNIMHEAIRYALNRGCLTVAAAGNFGDARRVYPAAFPEVVTVGGTDSDGHVTYFSSFGSHVDIVAPARDILSLRAVGTDLYDSDEPGLRIIADKYILADGTSMAAPLVAGAAAMLSSFAPGLDPIRVENILCQAADDITDPFDDGQYLPGYDTLSGWGRLNVSRALNLLMEPSAYISGRRAGEIVSGEIAFGLITTGGYQGPVDLYLGEGLSPNQWTLLHHEDQAGDTDSFYLWDSAPNSGYYAFRLVTSAGSSRVDLRAINSDRVEILSPIDRETVRYLTDIRGNAFGANYDSLIVEYRTEADTAYRFLASRTRLYFDESIYEWHMRNIPTGDCRIRISACLGPQVLTDSVTIFIRDIMRPGFPVHFSSYLAFSPGVADIDGDGLKEIVVGSQKGLYAIRTDGSLMDGFPVEPGRDMRSMPAFDDVDRDGVTDIIATGANLLGCYSHHGQPLRGWPKTASTGMCFFSYPIPVATQLYNRSDSVIIYMSRMGEVRAYKYNGDSYFYSLDGLFTALDPNLFDTNNFVGNSTPFITAADINDDGSNEVVSAYSTVQPYCGVYVWDGRSGLPPASWSSPRARKIGLSYGAVLANLDNDDIPDIVFAGTDTLGVVSLWASYDGRIDMPGWPVRLENLSGWRGWGGWLGGWPVCADIDGNGKKEIVTTYSNYDIGRVYVFRQDGTPYVELPNYPPGCILEIPSMLSNPVIADIDGDGLPNILCRAGHLFGGFEQLYAWEPTGEVTAGFPIITPTSPDQVASTPFVPIVDDIDNDGKIEIILCGDAMDLYVWDLDAPYRAEGMVWPKFGGDAKNSGINRSPNLPDDVADAATSIPDQFDIASIYPNPFNPSTTITFTLDRGTDINLEIFNILGQKVITLAAGQYPAGRHTCRWVGTDASGGTVASGVYFARLNGEGRHAARKMVLVR